MKQSQKDILNEKEKSDNDRTSLVLDSLDDDQKTFEEEKVDPNRTPHQELNFNEGPKQNKATPNELESLQEQLKKGLLEHELENIDELTQEIEKKSKELDEYQRRNREKMVKQLGPIVQDLQRLQMMSERIQDLKKIPVSPILPELDELDILEQQLKEGLTEHELGDLEALSEEIGKKIQELDDCRKRNREKMISKLEPIVQDLQRLQSISERIQELKKQKVNLILSDLDELENLERQLREGLLEYELENLEELTEEIERKRQDLAECRKRNREKMVNQLEPVVQDLERLQSISERIQELKKAQVNPLVHELDNLEKQLKEGLVEFELETVEELTEEIERKRQDLAECRKRNREKMVNQLEPVVQDLERLQSISERIQEIKKSSVKMRSQAPEPKEEDNQARQSENHEAVAVEVDIEIDSQAKRLNELRNLEDDISCYPDCVEKSLLKLKYFTMLKSSNPEDLAKQGLVLSEQADQEIEQELTTLRDRSQQEDLSINEEIKKIEANVGCQGWKEVETELNKVLKRLRPLDIHELFRLIGYGENAATLIEGQDVILFLGGTGAGKSTTIHYLAGSEMQTTQVNGMDHIGPKKIRTNRLEKVRTSSSSKSETRYITSVPVDLTELGSINRGQVILCDTPGFGDTAGPEVDIANALSIVEAIRKSKSVKPVILVSYKSIGDRYQGLKSLAHILAGMIPSIEDHIQCVSYLFTKYPKNQQNSIYASLMSVNKDLTEEEMSDKGFYSLFRGMLRRTQRKVCAVNPLNQEAALLILDDLVESNSIQRPREVFQFSLNESSRAALQDQAQKHQININNALKRSDYDLVQFRLDELKKLLHILGEDCLRKVYTECTINISRHLNKQYQVATEIINRCFTEENGLKEDELEDYKSYIKCAKAADKIRKDHLEKSVIESSAYGQNLKIQLNNTLESTKNKKIDEPSLKRILDKLKLITKSFPESDQYYKNACEVVEYLFVDCIKSFKIYQASDKFGECGNVLTRMQGSIQLLNDHWDSQDKQKTYEQLKNDFMEEIKNMNENHYSLLDQPELHDKDITKLQEWISKLESLKNELVLREHISVEDTELIYEQLIQKINKYFENINMKIQSLFEEKKEKAFGGIEALFKEMVRIRRITVIKTSTSVIFERTLSVLCGFIESVKNNVLIEIESMDKRTTGVNSKKICDYIEGLESSKWLSEFRGEQFSSIMDDVKERVIEYCKLSRDKIKSTPLTLKNSDKIQEVYQRVIAVEGMESFEKLFKGLEEINNDVKEIFYSQMKENILSVQGHLKKLQDHQASEKSFNFVKLEIMLEYLRVCKEVMASSDLVSKTLLDFESALQMHKRRMSTEMDELFDSIIDFKQQSVLSDLSPDSKQSSIYDDDLQDIMSTLGDEKNPQTNTPMPALEGVQDSPIKKIDAKKQKKAFLFEKVRAFASRLKELKEIDEKCPSILDLLGSETNLLEEWKRKLEDNCSEMNDEMSKFLTTNNIEELNNQILIAKALSQLDDYLINKYALLFRGFQDRYYQQAPEAIAGVNNDISQHNYGNVALFMTQLEKTAETNEVCRHQLNQLKGILNNSLEDLIDQVESQARFSIIPSNLVPERIIPIIQELRKIKKAKEYVESFLNAEVLDKLKNCENNIRKTIESGLLRLLKNLNDSIAQCNFYEFNKQKLTVSSICDELGSFCTKIVLEELSKLDEKEEKILKELQEKYQKLSINEFLVQPPKDIFAKFEKLSHEFSQQKYNEVQESIKSHIVNKFRESIEGVRNQDCGDMLNTLIRKIEYASNTLPTDLKNMLKNEIDDCKEEINNVKLDLENSLKSLIKGNDLKRAPWLIEQLKKTSSFSLIRQLEDHCLVETAKLKSEIVSRIQSKKIKEIFFELRSLNEYKTCLGAQFGFLEAYWTEIEDYIGRVCREKFSLFVKGMKQEMQFLDESSPVEEDSIYLIDFNELLNNCRIQKICFSQTFLEDFNSKFIEMNKILSDYFKELSKKYNNALNEPDIDTLARTMKSIQIWGKFLPKIQTYANTGSNAENFDKSFENLLETLAQVESFEKVKKSIPEKIQVMKQELSHEKLINEKTKKWKSSRDGYYEALNKKIMNLMRITTLEGLNIEAESVIHDAIEKLQAQALNLYTSTEALAKQVFEQETIRNDDLKQLNMNLNNIISLEKHLKAPLKIEMTFDKIEQQFISSLSKWEGDIEREGQSDQTPLRLIKMKKMAENIEQFNSEIDKRINEILQSYQQKFHIKGIVRLGQQLNQDKSGGYGQRIVSDYKCFQGFSLSLFNTKTQAYGIEKVLDNLKGNDIDKECLKNRYSEFEGSYRYLVKYNLKPKIDLSQLTADTKLAAGRVTQDSVMKGWGAEVAPRLPRLLAHIFAIWTLKNSEHYFEASSLENKDSYLLQPHAAQVISIFRLLGIGEKKEILKNHLIQIGTGEGKSVTLAITATVFALFGLDVSCACYSSYLSERDYEAFKGLFDTLNVSKNIHYGNFNKLNEDALNINGDIRKSVRNFISQEEAAKQPRKDKNSKSTRILLIDEVDVFFSKDFYGGLYTPSTVLADSAIEALIDMIWKTKNLSLTLKKIKGTQEYKHCCERFKGWEPLIEEAVKDMLVDLKAYESHDYIVKEDKIGYREHEQISFNITQRYQTLFAYYAEHEKGNISEESLNENKSLRIKCGHFSYTEIPNQFDCILGVTGTLETLTNAEKKVIRTRYKISKNTFTPSVFGKNNLKFSPKDDVFVENADDYHQKIRKEVEQKIFGRAEGKRAVLVFFESAKKLHKCLDSMAFQDLKDEIEVLTEEANSQERETRVRRATSSGQITFLTKTFGRGTDFICHNEIVEKNGGVHVIQTFVSEELSEEIQIRGRTARQGNYGSYSMVLLESSLEKFLIKGEDIENVKKGKSLADKAFSALNLGEKKYDTMYELINERRNELFESQFGDNEKFVDAAKAYHDKSLAFLQALHSSDIEEIKNFLVIENEGASEAPKSRTVVLMDATGSMGQLLHKAKNSVGTMFERAYKILKDSKIPEGSFQVQFVVYRNYGDEENRILQSSIWETKPDNLRLFMEKISASGGYGDKEAAELGLWHANNEHEKESISQVILIGDAGANAEDEVTSKRNYKGEAYWTSTKFAKKTFWKEEAEKLSKNNIPVHAFYVHNRAKPNFTDISALTKGRCEFLNVNSSEGTETLVNLVTEALLENVGKQNGKGDSLVEAYRNIFIKSYN